MPRHRPWHEIFPRLLIILRALQEDDVLRDDLIDLVQAELGESGYGAAPDNR